MGLSTAVKTAMMALSYDNCGLIAYSCVSWLIHKEITASGGVVKYPDRFSK